MFHLKLSILLIALAIACVASLKSSVKTEKQFQQFIQKYDRDYEDKEERDFRYNNFLKTLERLHHKQKVEGANYGINKFADYSEEEMRAMKMKPIHPDALAKSCLAPNVTKAPELPMNEDAPPPAAFDWRSKGVVSPVKNQGQCGSCWTFSTAGNIESQYALAGNPLTNLSEQMIVDCSKGCTEEDGEPVCNSGCDGGWMWTAMNDIIGWGGLETEEAYPYTAETGPTCGFNNKTSKLYAAIQNYTCIGEDENQILLNLLSRGPLSIAMNADLLQDYESGVIDPNAWIDDDDGCDPTSLDHALLIVGYGVKEGIIENTPFWTVKNSWGEDWGEEGYFRIIRGEGACGINEAVTCAGLAPK